MARMKASDLTDAMKENATRTAYLVCVARGGETETKSGSNKYYNMYLCDDGYLWCEYGRVDVTRAVERYPAYDWDRIYKDKTKKRGQKSYKDVTGLKADAQVANGSSAGFVPIPDAQEIPGCLSLRL